MKKKYLRLSLILILVLSSMLIFFIYQKQSPQPMIEPLATQSNFIIAPAIIDAISDITHVSSLQSGIIKDIHVQVGQHVKRGEPLFSLESEVIENTLKMNKLSYKQNKNEIIIQKKQLHYLKNQLARLKSLDKRAISQAELQDKMHEVKMTTARLIQAEYALKIAKTNLKNTQLMLSQFTLRAPKDGIVLQINAHPNEYVGTSQQLIYLGDAEKIIVRISLDEREAYRFDPKAPACLIHYGDETLNIPLTFVQLDRYIITQERLNARVQEALYSFDRNTYPNLVAGQLFDARITLNT